MKKGKAQTRPTQDRSVKSISQRVNADLLMVGTYFVQDNQILINARLLDVVTGRPVPGGAGNVSGSRQDLLALTHSLARHLHECMTARDLALDSAPAGAATSGSASDRALDTSASSYTGLIVDARDFAVQRAMGPRILDEDGQVLYPDPKHVPDVDYLEDRGMAAYIKDQGDASRSGSHPLIVRAVNVSGPGRDDLVVSNETAEQIRQANQRGGFLSRWAISILVRPR